LNVGKANLKKVRFFYASFYDFYDAAPLETNPLSLRSSPALLRFFLAKAARLQIED